MTPGWRPVHFGGTRRPNSYQGEDSVELNPESYSCNEPLLVSLKTISAPIPSPIQDAFSDFSYSNMLRSSGMPYSTEFGIPEYSMADSRPQSNSPPSTSNTVSTFGFRSKPPLLPQALNENLSSAHQIAKGPLQSQPRKSTDVFTQRPAASESPPGLQSSFILVPSASDHMLSENVTIPRDEQARNSSNTPISHNLKSFPTKIPRQGAKAPQFQVASNRSQMLPPDTNTGMSDVSRKPSLYAIPAWPSSAMKPHPLAELVHVKPHLHPSNMVCRGYRNVNNGQVDSNAKRPYPNLQIQTPSTASVSQYQVQLETSNEDEEQPPRKRIRHRHAQTLSLI